MASLYEINSELLEAMQQAEQQAESNDGEITDSTAYELDRLEMDRETKIENTALYIKNLHAESASIKVEEDKLKSRRVAVDKKAERISEWLKFNLHGEIWNSGNYKISYRNSQSIEITDLSTIPKQFINEKEVITYSADKVAIKKAIKSGELVTGAELITKTKMEIK